MTLPVPGTFIINTDGQIKKASVVPDYTKRMEPSDAINVLKTL
ncbi:hypothetical protein [Chengkuizengella axinellae]|uniref:Redoxin domain-containing protein n=1 Tax=Chengkuizengella axinellae TaxID=3064388 RepID=A0ABT9J2I3_9BACL|nr:hypothetical protein [Chengkuizengella sp. 2205SS18-9]MDP5275824.1 hypothetical protein [Chengkuizengella sp. 2205SS18-9]